MSCQGFRGREGPGQGGVGVGEGAPSVPGGAGPTWSHSRRRLGLRSRRYTCSSLWAVAQELASSSVHSRSRSICTSRSSVYRKGRWRQARGHLPTGHVSRSLRGGGTPTTQIPPRLWQVAQETHSSVALT